MIKTKDSFDLDQIVTVAQPRFATIQLTPTNGSSLFNADITKVGADLNDHIIAF